MVTETIRQLWDEPRVAEPPRRVWRDWALVTVLLCATAVEVIARNDLGWPVLAGVIGAGTAVSMLWRRTHPLAVVVTAFAGHAVSDSVTFVGAEQSAMLFSSVALAILPYALARWASGRHVVIGMGLMIGSHVPHGPNAITNIGEFAAGGLFFLLPAALGGAVRYRSNAWLSATDQAKLREREQLARELHDTVAHHVSAIIIQAQAGRTVAAVDPEAAVRALGAIESEAARTLSEMRFMVGALRQGEAPDVSPQRGVADIARLARDGGPPPTVDVRLAPGLDDLRPSVGAALYRLAQESITNAVRHARHASRVLVTVAADDHSVRLVVSDDGDSATFGAISSAGYGLIGMAERAKLLGGTLEAGPSGASGWTITAVLPRNGVAS